MKNVPMCCIGVTEGKIEKRMQNENKHLNFHLRNTFCLPEVYTKFHNPKSSSC